MVSVELQQSNKVLVGKQSSKQNQVVDGLHTLWIVIKEPPADTFTFQ